MGLQYGSSPETNVRDNFEMWSAYEWPRGGDEWSNNFGSSRGLWFGMILPRVHHFLPADHVLEIAPGYGRCSQFLVREARRLTLVDLVPKCIEACRARFAEHSHVRYVVNDGMTLPGVPDASVDFVFSWDSLVHVDRAPIRSYLHEIARVLRPGGHAFLHHSNLGMQAAELTQEDIRSGVGNRRESVSAAIVAGDAQDAGLRCVAQELIPQARPGLFNDCYSLFRSDPARVSQPPVVRRRDNWAAEVGFIKESLRFYAARVDASGHEAAPPKSSSASACWGDARSSDGDRE